MPSAPRPTSTPTGCTPWFPCWNWAATAEALEFATKDLELSQQLTDDMVSSVEEPVLERPGHGQGGRGA